MEGGGDAGKGRSQATNEWVGLHGLTCRAQFTAVVGVWLLPWRTLLAGCTLKMSVAIERKTGLINNDHITPMDTVQ